MITKLLMDTVAPAEMLVVSRFKSEPLVPQSPSMMKVLSLSSILKKLAVPVASAVLSLVIEAAVIVPPLAAPNAVVLKVRVAKRVPLIAAPVAGRVPL